MTVVLREFIPAQAWVTPSLPACKELRRRGREEVLVGLIESVRVADELEPVPNAGTPRERERARVVLQELITVSQQRYVPPYNLAVVHHGLWEREEALAWLEKAFEERDVWLTFLAVDRKWDTLRSDQRFVNLLERMKLSK